MTLRELKIKTNVLKRIYRENIGYGQEEQQQLKRIDKLIADGADEADVRKQKEVLEDTLQMIPDVQKRLAKAYADLEDKVTDPAYAGTDELKDALQALEEYKPE
ncbi:tubulin binding cofactor A [Phycomyces nitens]|nr:tubulin binding cofactor A [Phycomyces nitens]